MEEGKINETEVLTGEKETFLTQMEMYNKSKEIVTNYGMLKGITSIGWYDNGNLKECQVNEEIILQTPAGTLIPGYQNEGVRNKYMKSLTFYESGAIKKIALQEQTLINTHSGTFEAELLTFYNSGTVKRIFPLNGKITGYWTEENEYALARPVKLTLPFKELETKIIGIHLYESGEIKSLTIWPKELLSIQYANVAYGVRFGLSLYSTGAIKSLEPAYPVKVTTLIGEISAFDVNAVGINGDVNSLQFYEDGRIKSLVTSTDIIHVKGNGYVSNTSEENMRFLHNEEYIIMPGLRKSMLGEEAMEIVPIYIEFTDYDVIIRNEENYKFDIRYSIIEISNHAFMPKMKCSSCANCNGCG